MFFLFSKPRISECKESSLALPSESGFVQQRRKVPVKRVQRKFIYFAERKAVGRSHSGLCNCEKKEKQAKKSIKRQAKTRV